MAEHALNGPVDASRPSEFIEAIKEAIIAACIAFLMFSVIVGIKTSSSSSVEGLALSYRLTDALLISVGVGILRLIFDLFLWRRLASFSFLPKGTLRNVLLMLLGLSYIVGA
ncbi:MAG: hypothetical protein KTR19_08985, partial [Hyphomicrobiales bacterium]|nr:hypothetical protein [Hyphomicrobiales bacterium]